MIWQDSNPVTLSADSLRTYFNLPLVDAARKMGICATAIKKVSLSLFSCFQGAFVLQLSQKKILSFFFFPFSRAFVLRLSKKNSSFSKIRAFVIGSTKIFFLARVCACSVSFCLFPTRWFPLCRTSTLLPPPPPHTRTQTRTCTPLSLSFTCAYSIKLCEYFFVCMCVCTHIYRYMCRCLQTSHKVISCFTRSYPDLHYCKVLTILRECARCLSVGNTHQPNVLSSNT